MTPSELFISNYEASTGGSGVFTLSQWSVVRLYGEDRTIFLHNMCTNEIKALPSGKCCEAFFTDVKGKILAHAIVLIFDEYLELLTVPGQAEGIIAHLERYIIREDVKLEDQSDKICWSLVFGKQSEKINNSSQLAFPTNMLETPSYLVPASAEEIAKGSGDSCVLIEESIWNTLRIEASYPFFGVDFDSANLPQEIARDELAIHFNKGCYLGQETVSRIDALGHVNRHLCRLKFASGDIPELGTKLMVDDQENGIVTSCCWSPGYEGPLALAMMRRGGNSVGCELNSVHGKATII